MTKQPSEELNDVKGLGYIQHNSEDNWVDVYIREKAYKMFYSKTWLIWDLRVQKYQQESFLNYEEPL
jgi:tRNA A-37 threonylcarbamoyl transferase component Bud32